MGAEPDSEKQLTMPIRRPAGTLEEQKRRRAEAMKVVVGMWKGRADIPQDGIEYQEQIRNEWP